MEASYKIYEVEVSWVVGRGGNSDFYMVLATSEEEAIQKVEKEYGKSTKSHYSAQPIDLNTPYYVYTR